MVEGKGESEGESEDEGRRLFPNTTGIGIWMRVYYALPSKIESN
jgi:hypothetical protein